MKEFVGAEFLIAKMILAKNSAAISITELNKLGVNVRRLSINEGVNVVFLTSREEVYSAVWDYSDYFESSYDKEGNLSSIKIKSGKNLTDLNDKFLKLLPLEVMNLLDKAIESIGA